MSTPEDENATPVEAADESTATAEPAAEEKHRLALEVEIRDVGPCKKHLKVVIPRDEIDRQMGDSLKSVRREAAVPGFRPGRAPVVLVQKRFKKELESQVKSTLLLQAMEQIDEENKINPISRPQLDLDAIKVPDDGPLTFEMDVEVQPEFPLPEYKGLVVARPTRTITDTDVDAQLLRFLEQYAQEVPKLDGGAELGDLVIADLKFDKDGIALNEAKEVKFRLQNELRFQDGRVPELAAALAGARSGDVREAQAHIGSSSPDPALRNQTIRVTFHILDLKTLRVPEVDAEFLERLGFESETELREALRGLLERRVEFQRRQAVRKSVLDQLVESTPFDLPAELVARQERSTLRNKIQEMRQAGLSDSVIRAREAEIRANAHESTLRSLKEFFILAKIAEAEDLKIEESDLDAEIESIAERSDESPRRVRARIEKEGLGESLATSILERKTVERIVELAKPEDIPMAEEHAVETLDTTVGPALIEQDDEEPAADATDGATEASADAGE